MLTTDPIIAISSPPGRSIRGLIRISAAKLTPYIQQTLTPMPQQRTPTACRLSIANMTLPCLALYQAAPQTFTTQDILEIQFPGNPALLERALHALLQQLQTHDPHARLAEPGEFTQRAYLAGRIDLTKAEGIAATIGAVSDAQLHAARLLRTGKLGRFAAELVERIAGALALVEAGIDFVDQDDVVPITPYNLNDQLTEALQQIQSLLTRSRSWAALDALPWVVLVGPPNAGKSTLFNALLGHERAVISDAAGTTRDILTEPLRLNTPQGQAEVLLVDIAGIDPTQTAINSAMQTAALQAIERSELIIHLHDPTQSELQSLMTFDQPTLHIETKADLTTPSTHSRLQLSAKQNIGLTELKAEIARHLSHRSVTLAAEMLALNPRHHQELTAARAALQHAHQLTTPQCKNESLSDPELIAESLRRALDPLASLGGEMTPDDVIGNIFATFCVGK